MGRESAGVWIFQILHYKLSFFPLQTFGAETTAELQHEQLSTRSKHYKKYFTVSQ